MNDVSSTRFDHMYVKSMESWIRGECDSEFFANTPVPDYDSSRSAPAQDTVAVLDVMVNVLDMNDSADESNDDWFDDDAPAVMSSLAFEDEESLRQWFREWF